MCRRIFLISFLIAQTASVAQTYRIAGFVAYTNYARPNFDEDEVAHSFGSFSVTVSNCLWNIRADRGDNAFDYVETGSDQRYVYTLTSHKKWAERQCAEGKVTGYNSLNGRVSQAEMPLATDPLSRILWWIYCSHCYVTANRIDGKAQCVPIAYDDLAFEDALSLLRVTLPSQIDLNPLPPRLPSRIINFDDGYTRSWEQPFRTPFVLPVRKVQRIPPLEKPLTDVSLAVTGWRTNSGLVLPETISIRRFRPYYLTNTWVAKLHETYCIKATNFTTDVQDASILPEISGIAFVADGRFIEGTPSVFTFPYNLTNRLWPSDGEVRTFPGYKRQLTNQQRDEKVAKSFGRARVSTRLPVIILSCGFVGSTIAFFLLGERNKRNKQHQRIKTSTN